MRAGDTIRFTAVTTVEPGGVRFGWKAGGTKPRRMVYVALVLGVERHPDDIGNEDVDALYEAGVLCDPNEVIRSFGWVKESGGVDG